MKIIIFGTGGVGGYFGGKLAQAGYDATFIARGKHLEAIQKTGLKIDSIHGNFIVHPANATDSTQHIEHADLIILATKAWQLDSAIEQIKPIVKEDTTILPLLNGIEHIATLQKVFGNKHLIGGLCRISVFIEDAGHIKHMGVNPYIAFGELDNSKSDRILSIHKMFSSIENITAEIPADINVAMWEKYVFISGTSGVGAFVGKPINEYRDIPEFRNMLITSMTEAVNVAQAYGVILSKNLVEDIMKRIDLTPKGMLASMQKDIMEGRPSELEDQIGGMIRMGKKMNITTPTYEKIYIQLLPFEQKARGIK